MAHSALCQAGGLLKNLIDNLDGKNGEEWVEILRRVLRRQNPFVIPFPRFEPTFIIDGPAMGVGVMEEAGRRFGFWGSNYSAHFAKIVSDFFERWTERLVVVTPRQLGFDTHTTFPHLWVRAEEFGLARCSEGAGLLALLQYSDWFMNGKPVYFAGVPVNGLITYIVRDRKPGVRTAPVGMQSDVFPDELWVFRMP